MPKELPSPEMLRKLLRYDPVAGKLFWRERAPSMFSSLRACRSWNGRYAGREAFTSVTANGYRIGNVLGVNCLGHRVAWAVYTGYWPNGQIDHQNGDRTDNRFENFRDVSHADNGKNAQRRSDNTSGAVGVVWDRRKKKWVAQIHCLGKNVFLGYFSSFDDAAEARRLANEKHGFHQNHGRIA